jgi:hypothetical protein
MQSLDWRARPFTKEMIRYACLDVHYLLPLYAILKKKILTVGLEDDVADEELHEDRSTVIGETTLHVENVGEDKLETVNEDEDDWSEDNDDNEAAAEGDGMGGGLEEEDDDEAMWEGWGVEPGQTEPNADSQVSFASPSQMVTQGASNTAEPEVTSPSNLGTEISHEELLKIRADKGRGDSFSSHVLQPTRAVSSATQLREGMSPSSSRRAMRCRVTPEGVELFKRVCRNTAKSCIKLWKPKEVNPNSYYKVKGLAEAKKLSAWTDLNTFVFRQLFQWREQTAKVWSFTRLGLISTAI